MEPFVIDMEVFPVVIMFYVGKDEDKIKSVLAASEITKSEIDAVVYDSTRDGNTYLFKEGQILIWVYDDEINVHNFCTIIHEADHAVDYMMEVLSIPKDDSTSEVHAYALEYVMSCIMNELKVEIHETTRQAVPTVGESSGAASSRNFLRGMWL